jgi:DNA-binding transcriptional regulator YhcF (GntR family)
MKKNARVLREILFRVYDRGEFFMSQKSLAEACGLSMDTVNRVVSRLADFRAIEKKPFGFRVADPRKCLLYWAATRNLVADVVYSTYSPDSVSEIERDMPEDTVFTAFSGFQRKFGSGPTSYEEVYVYARADEVMRRFPETSALRTNIYVLPPDPHLSRLSSNGAPPLAQLYVDLWQIGGSAADRYLLQLERRLEAKPVEAFKRLLVTEGP